MEKREEVIAKTKEVQWHVAAKRGSVKAMAEGRLKELTQAYEKAKAQVRARVEHPVASALRRCPAGCLRQAVSLRSAHILKNLFKHRKTRSRGLMKNTAQLRTLFALANLFFARGALLNAART